MRVREYMHKVETVSGEKSVAEIARMIKERMLTSVIVEDRDEMKGVITGPELLHQIIEHGKDPSKIRANELTFKSFSQVDSHTMVERARKQMEQLGVDSLIVMENNEIVGCVNHDNLMEGYKYSMGRKLYAKWH